MAVELRSLRVSAELDTTAYVAGARAKTVADEQMVASGSQAAQAIASVGQAAGQSDTKITASVNLFERLSRQFVSGYADAQKLNSALNGLSRELDRGNITVAQAQPVLDGLFRRYSAVADGAQFAAKGQAEFAQAIATTSARMAAQSAEMQKSAAAHRTYAAANQNGSQGFATANVAAQFQDVAVVAAMGQSPLTAGLQQGLQLGTALTMQLGEQGAAGAAKTLFGGLTALLSPINLLAVGGTAAVVGLIQYFNSAEYEAKSADAALKAHEANISAIKEAWGEAAAGLSAYGNADRTVMQAQSVISGFNLKKEIDKFTAGLAEGGDLLETEADRIQNRLLELQKAMETETDATRLSGMATEFKTLYDSMASADRVVLGATEKFAPLKSAIDAFAESARNGTPDYIGLQRAIAEGLLADPTNADLLKLTETVGELIDRGVRLQSAMEASTGAVDQFGRGAGNAASLLAGLNREAEIYASAIERISKAGAPEVSPAAQVDRDYFLGRGSAADKGQRDELAEARRAAAERLENQRLGSLVPTPTNRPNDIEIWDANDAAREQREREAERAQKEAERQRRQDEQKTKPYESMVQRQQDQLEVLHAEVGALDQSEEARRRVIASLQVEQQIRGLNIDQYGAEANALRANAAEIIQLQEQRTKALEAQREAEQDWEENRDIAKGFMSDLVSGLRDGEGAWKSFADAAMNALNRITDKLMDRAMDSILDYLMPKPGGQSGSGGFTANTTAGAFFGAMGKAANDNVLELDPIIVGSASRGVPAASVNGKSMTGSVAQQAWSFFKGKGLSDQATAAMLGQIHAESGFNPSAIGDGGLAHGLFQHHPNRGGNSSLITSGAQGQLQHAWNELQTSESGVLARLRAAPDLRSATRAAIGFERPVGWSANNPEGGHNFAGRLGAAEQAMTQFGGKVTAANSAVDGMTTGATAAAKAAGGAAQGMGGLANALSNAGGGGGGGGLLSGLGSIFSSLTGPSWKPTTTAGNFFGANGVAAMGAWSTGGFTGHGGVNDPAGVVHRGEVVWSQRDVARAGGVGAVEAMRLGFQGYASGGPVSLPPTMPRMQAPANQRGGGLTVNRTINNYAGVEVDETESRDTDGNVMIETNIRRVSRDEMTNPSRKGNRRLRSNYGLQQKILDR